MAVYIKDKPTNKDKDGMTDVTIGVNVLTEQLDSTDVLTGAQHTRICHHSVL